MKPSIEIQIQGKSKSYPPGITPGEILRDNRAKNGCEVVAAALNGSAVDLSAPLTESGTLEFVTARSPRGLEIVRHSTAHIMAQAVKELFPDAKVTDGPVLEEGFCYDFDSPRPFTYEDLDKIEQRMSEIVRGGLSFRRVVLPKDEAIQLFHHKGEPYKVELLEGVKARDISLYSQGEFIDVCLGPHVPNSGFIKAFKLTGVSGAYWRGDERNPMLQRICGTAFASEETLENYLLPCKKEMKIEHRRPGVDGETGTRAFEVGKPEDEITNVLPLEEFVESL